MPRRRAGDPYRRADGVLRWHLIEGLRRVELQGYVSGHLQTQKDLTFLRLIEAGPFWSTGKGARYVLTSAGRGELAAYEGARAVAEEAETLERLTALFVEELGKLA